MGGRREARLSLLAVTGLMAKDFLLGGVSEDLRSLILQLQSSQSRRFS